jgi:hypothetical protein
MAEWFKALVLKTRDRKVRGFESYSLRHLLTQSRRLDELYRFLVGAHPGVRPKRADTRVRPYSLSFLNEELLLYIHDLARKRP